MKKLQNCLYINTQKTYLHKERETLVIEQDRKKLLQLPIHSIQQIFCFGNVLVSPFLLGFCGENSVGLAFFSEYGKYLGRLQGRQSGNILLRKAQYKQAVNNPFHLARTFVAAKLVNSRSVLQRHSRNHGTGEALSLAIQRLSQRQEKVLHSEDLDTIRGLEGDAAAVYFSVFDELLLPSIKKDFSFKGRNRRPPKDPVNALLSFCYSLLGNEISSALQAVGLDPQAGFLHSDRPGRDSLAQDLLEEFRAWWVDRFVLSLINRKQLSRKDFDYQASGAVVLKSDARKSLLSAWQEKKQDEMMHPYLEEKVAIGLLPHIQAMLLARFLRGELACYPPFVAR
ncbi:type I-C CRISPR-associated endonuclease Cas1 [bacterium AH-315-K03]|nr:type I-C CRISPR-associated endonuclease Cas1 [bacterium AH-315-K03]